jgi:hypothetical protein
MIVIVIVKIRVYYAKQNNQSTSAVPMHTSVYITSIRQIGYLISCILNKAEEVFPQASAGVLG